MKILLSLLSLVLTLNAQPLERVKLQLKWKTQFQFAGFIAAKERGFFKDEGLDIELLEYTPTTTTLRDLEEGKTTFAVSDSSVILEVAKGKKLVALMAIYQKSPYVLMSLKSSNIKTLSDIENKKVALYNDMNSKAVASMLKMNDISFKRMSISNQLEQLQSGEIDLAIAYLSNEPNVAKSKGIEVNILDLKDYGFNRYGDILFTLEETVKNRPELVAKMYRATKKGFKYAYSHIDEMATLIYNKYNTQRKSKASYVYEANVLKKLLGKEGEFGKLDPAKVDSIGYVYAYSGSIEYNKENLKNFIYKPVSNNLTPKENEWLDEHHIVKIRVGNYPPYQMSTNGKAEGIAVDYVEKIFKKYNIAYEFISSDTESWSDALKSIRDKKKIDLLLAAKKTPQREKYMLFTDNYISSAWVIFTRDDSGFISEIKELEGKNVAVEEGFVIHKLLQTRYPQINLKLMKGKNPTGRAMEALAVGKVDAYIGNLTVGSYLIKSLSLDNIKVAAPTPFGNHENAMALRDDWSPLVSIINRELNAMSIQDKNKIYNKYLSIQYEYGISLWDVSKWIAILTFIFGSIVIAISIANRKLRTEIKEKKTIQTELNALNISLEDRVKIEIDKNKKQQLLMMEQTKLAQMGEMIANIAHQWRQPLAQVNSCVLIIDIALQKSGIKNERIDSKLSAIEDLTQHMSHTIDNFQNFFDADKEETLFYLRETVVNAITIMEGTLSSNFTQVEMEVDALLECKGYPLELQQVLVVLLSNANDALTARKVENPKIIVDLKDLADTYLLSISDNAGGVDTEKIDQVFEPYFTTKHKSQGRGVGLYMAKMIVEEGMKGSLTVENKTDGACFSIEITKGKQ